MPTATIKLQQEEELTQFLITHSFSVEELGENVYRVQREDELPVFVKQTEKELYFEVDLGSAKELESLDFYRQLLDLNTEVLPVSFGLDTTNPEDVRLVLVESRELGDLSDQELLAVFDALELAVDRATPLFESLMN